MRARIFALLILVILVGLPILGYWYFFVKQTSGIMLSFGSGVTAEVSLRGTFSHSWLPLADRALSFSQRCESVCTFDTIPPATYSLRIVAEGFAEVTDTIALQSGEHIER